MAGSHEQAARGCATASVEPILNAWLERMCDGAGQTVVFYGKIGENTV